MRKLLLSGAMLSAAVLGMADVSAASWMPPPLVQTVLRAASLPVARAAWPASPCNGKETVHVDADQWLDAQDRIDGTESLARASAATCEIWMRHISRPVEFCTALVHEELHLAGFVHDTQDGPHPERPDLAALMVAAPAVYGPCAALFPGPTSADIQGRATEALWWQLPGPLGGWVIRCGLGHCRAYRIAGRRCTRFYEYGRQGSDLALAGPTFVCRRPKGRSPASNAVHAKTL